jgi:hypothetical protein
MSSRRLEGLAWIAVGISLTFQAAMVFLTAVPSASGGLGNDGGYPDFTATLVVSLLLLGLGIGSPLFGARRAAERGSDADVAPSPGRVERRVDEQLEGE